ncbi:MAG: hypothetical protein M5U16_04585 [Hyphomicrobium sp.]|nr:hypothetical protein [Hyphomicrobium sp.]
MPDYGRVLEHLGLIENDDPELIRDAIQDEIDGLEAQGDDGEGEEAGDAVE